MRSIRFMPVESAALFEKEKYIPFGKVVADKPNKPGKLSMQESS